MADDNDYRVEARLGGASQGISPTTEQIQTLLERRRAHEKLTRPPPKKAFASVLRGQGQQTGSDNDSESEAMEQPDEAPSKSPETPMSSNRVSSPVGAQRAKPAPKAPPDDSFVRRSVGPKPLAAAARTAAQSPTQASDKLRPSGPTTQKDALTKAPVRRVPTKIIIRG